MRSLVLVGLILLALLSLWHAWDDEPPALGSGERHAEVLVAKSPSVNPYAAQVDLGPDFIRYISYKPHARSGPLRHAVEAVGGIWQRIAACESGGNWQDREGFYEGGLQFANGTWLAYGGGEFAQHAYDATPAQQITVAERVLAAQGWGAWPVCSRKAGAR